MIKFSQEVNFLLENSMSPNLKILLEEEESLFSMPDDDDSDDASGDDAGGDNPDGDDSVKKKKKEKKDPDNPDDSDDPDSDDSDDGEVDGVTKSQFDALTKDMNLIKKTIVGATSNDGIGSVESFIANAVPTSESVQYNKKSISRFLNEDIDAEEVEADIEVLDRVLSKGTELVDKFKKGQDIDINAYVTAAINAYSNFDNLFAKETIVKQAAINVLVLNSGAKAEQYISEFEELFHEELHKQFGIEYEEHALITKKFDNGTGAVKQG